MYGARGTGDLRQSMELNPTHVPAELVLKHQLHVVQYSICSGVNTVILLSMYSHVPIKRIDVLLNFVHFPQTDIDVKTALIGVKTGPNKRICFEKISVSIRLLGT